MPRGQPDLLTQLEQDVLDRTVPLTDLLRSCLELARRTQAAGDSVLVVGSAGCQQGGDRIAGPGVAQLL